MSWVRQIYLCMAVCTAALTIHAQVPPAAPVRINTKPLVPPTPASPVKFFRELLVMSPVERNHSLSNRPPEARARIMAKLREYQALEPNERELRLRATELRWYLTPLFRTPPPARGARLAQLPEDFRETVTARLAQWDALPPALQTEFLENDRAVQYFATGGTTNAVTAEQQKLSEQFNQFFELTAAEKSQALGTLSEAERAVMDKTLQEFEKLPPKQRSQCVRNYAKFAGMSAAERAGFLKSAELWAKMSPQERKSWRDLVANVPIMPPMPLASKIPTNIMPPKMVKPTRPAVATN